jgi:hypothetical protein
MGTVTNLGLALCLLNGCAVVGPSSISAGRGNYNEVINDTEDEQIMLAIVKGRYGDTFSLLAVNGVAANVKFRTSAGIEVPVGPDKNYLENLVPFSAGIAYEENPTISYAPVQGELYLRQLMSPIPLDIMIMITRASGPHSASFLNTFIDSINDMKNSAVTISKRANPDHRFKRFVEIYSDLHQVDILKWVADPRKEIAYDILLSNYAPDYTEEVREFLDLLDVPMPGDETKDILLPVFFGLKGRGVQGVAISTRSTYDLIEILRTAIDVPREHVEAGLVYDSPEINMPEESICIRSSEDKPDNAAFSVFHQGYWFYIDETDLKTKFFYIMVRLLWSVSISAGSDQGAAPVLTIPVGT